MNKNILFSALIVSGFFMLLSFILRIVFFIDYLSLILHPLTIFIGWFILTTGLFLFLKHDFTEIYKMLNFFDKDEIHSINEDNLHIDVNPSQTKGSKKLNIQDSGEDDYQDIFQSFDPTDPNKKDYTQKKNFSEYRSNMNYLDDSGKVKSKKGKQEKDVWDDAGPKKLAKVVKKFLNET